MANNKGSNKPPDANGIITMGATIDRGVSIIIYADPGTGKTTLASTLPVGETIIINTEAGYGPLLGTGLEVFNLDLDLKKLERFYQHLRVEKHPFRNLNVVVPRIRHRITSLRKRGAVHQHQAAMLQSLPHSSSHTRGEGGRVRRDSPDRRLARLA